MKDKVFLDTNVVIYSHTSIDLAKQKIAQELMINNFSVIGLQVLQETANTFLKKLKHDWHEVRKVLTELSANNDLYLNSESTILTAGHIVNKYGFSFYDSLIISAAIESGCSILYTEDLQHNQLVENKIRVINPFK